MPNTLAHVGLQALTTKYFDRTADIKWIAVGCIIPDLPWISQRIVSSIAAVDLLDLRIYCMIQASLFFCLLFSAAVAAIVQKPIRILLILGTNSFLHLLLDSLQTKLANGVHIAAPITWQMTTYPLFWPESNLTLILTALGFCLILFYGLRDRNIETHFVFNRIRLAAAILLVTSYIMLPFALFQGPLSADNHFVKTLQDKTNRVGKEIGFDRCHYDKAGSTIRVFTGEQFTITNNPPLANGKVSLIGTFVNHNTINVKTIHPHGKTRDLFSYVGLLLILFLWFFAAHQKKIQKTTTT